MYTPILALRPHYFSKQVFLSYRVQLGRNRILADFLGAISVRRQTMKSRTQEVENKTFETDVLVDWPVS